MSDTMSAPLSCLLKCTRLPPPCAYLQTLNGGAQLQQQQAAPAAPAAKIGFVLPAGVATELLTSGISVSTANTATNPLGQCCCAAAQSKLAPAMK